MATSSDVDESERVREFLLSPLAYPETTTQVEVQETHISWVYLTDRYVYKQKKPVRFEFLDFTTLADRKHFCEQEVELNRRFSPEVYLGVTPVSRNDDGEYQLKAGPNTVEWLVKMVRLDESTTLQSLIQSDSLTPEYLKRLCDRLTEFYSAQAPAMMRSGDFQQNIQRHVLANQNDLLVSLPATEAKIRYVTNAQMRCMSLESECFMQRVADGRVVDGHGDLRPEHIFFRRGKPLAIDCIEFNAEYRRNDVVDELAFLAMECDRLGNHLVGESILASYLTNSPDDCPHAITSFYKCYRACVRAKVEALRATQSKGATQLDARKRAQEYIGLARDYADDFSPPLLIIVGGLSGTGKSTLARALQAMLSADLLQTDLIRQELFESATNERKYTTTGRIHVYTEMLSRIDKCLESTPTVVLDGTFYSRQLREMVANKAQYCGARLIQIQCECPDEIAKLRIQQRLRDGQSPSEATPSLVDNQRRTYELPLPTEPVLYVDTTKDLVDQSALAFDFIRRTADQLCVH